VAQQRRAVDGQFGHDVSAVDLDRRRAQADPGADFLVGQAVAEEAKQVLLMRGQDLVERHGIGLQ